MSEVIDIHPLDLGDILDKMDYPELTIVKGEGAWHGEFVYIGDKKYRQTLDVPATSEYAKKFLGEV